MKLAKAFLSGRQSLQVAGGQVEWFSPTGSDVRSSNPAGVETEGLKIQAPLIGLQSFLQEKQKCSLQTAVQFQLGRPCFITCPKLCLLWKVSVKLSTDRVCLISKYLKSRSQLLPKSKQCLCGTHIKLIHCCTGMSVWYTCKSNPVHFNKPSAGMWAFTWLEIVHSMKYLQRQSLHVNRSNSGSVGVRTCQNAFLCSQTRGAAQFLKGTFYLTGKGLPWSKKVQP